MAYRKPRGSDKKTISVVVAVTTPLKVRNSWRGGKFDKTKLLVFKLASGFSLIWLSHINNLQVCGADMI